MEGRTKLDLYSHKEFSTLFFCRYQVLVQPLRSLAGRPMIWRKVLAAWILAFIFAIPQLFIFVQTDEGLKSDGSMRHLCRSQGYTAKWQRKGVFHLPDNIHPNHPLLYHVILLLEHHSSCVETSGGKNRVDPS